MLEGQGVCVTAFVSSEREARSGTPPSANRSHWPVAPTPGLGRSPQVWLDTVLTAQEDLDGAQRHTGRGLDSARDPGDRLVSYIALINLSRVAIRQAAYARAGDHLKEGNCPFWIYRPISIE
jgi:hypothetical protein